MPAKKTKSGAATKTAKKPAKSGSRAVARNVETAAVASTTTESTFTLTVDVKIFPKSSESKASIIKGTQIKKEGEEVISFNIEGEPPNFNLATVLEAFDVENEDLKGAADGDVTLQKLSVNKTTKDKTTTSELDFDITFTPSQTFILNKFPKIIEIEKLEVTFEKKEITTEE